MEISWKHTQFEDNETSPIKLLSLKSGTDALDAYAEVADAFRQVAGNQTFFSCICAKFTQQAFDFFPYSRSLKSEPLQIVALISI